MVEQKYYWGGAGVRGCKATDYPCEASMCEGQKLAPLAPPVLPRPSSEGFVMKNHLILYTTKMINFTSLSACICCRCNRNM